MVETVLEWGQPDELFICLPSFNQDHQALFDATITALRPGRFDHIKRIWMYEYPGNSWGPEPPRGGRCYVRMGRHDLTMKLAALAVHKSQGFGTDHLQHVGMSGSQALSALRGSECSAEHAELFYLLREISLTMSVRILLDPVLTAHPSRCSTFIQFATLMQRWTAARNDVFFYCLLADWDLPKGELDWLPQHPNIRYIRVPQHPDRTKEYFTLRNEIDHLISFNGELWDFDILITVRAGLAALYKLLVTSPRQLGVRYLKQVWVIENMPVMSFKGSVMVIDPDVQDRFTLDGYLAADRVTMMSYHEKAGAMRIARKFYAPTVVLELERKIKEVLPAQFSEFKLKDPAHWFEPDKDHRFCIAYVGRLAAAGTNIDKIYNVMTNQWIIHGGDRVRMVVCTVSRGGPQEPSRKTTWSGSTPRARSSGAWRGRRCTS